MQCKKFKSFLLCTVYRSPAAPIDFYEKLSETFVHSLLHGSNVIILGDLNCNLIGGDLDGHALSDFCSTFRLSQLFKTATRVTENSKSLIDVTLTTNENIIHACDVIQSAISDHSLVSLTFKLIHWDQGFRLGPREVIKTMTTIVLLRIWLTFLSVHIVTLFWRSWRPNTCL